MSGICMSDLSTCKISLAVVFPGDKEEENGKAHADERDEEPPGKADVLLDSCHTQIR